MTRRILLNPGPVTLSPGVRAALTGDDLCHREPTYRALQAEVRSRLDRVYGNPDESWSSVLLTGSGTSAVESMLTSLPRPDESVLVVANGAYGDRMAAMLRGAGRPHAVLDFGWTNPVDPERVAAELDRRPEVRYVAVVHHETTTGRLNRLDELTGPCAMRGVRLLVDAVSSFGAEALDLSEPAFAALASTANKCLHGVPGTALVLARRDVLESDAPPGPSLYLDARRHYGAQEADRPAFTPAVQSMFALRQALVELEEAGGWTARNAAYRERSTVVREGLADLGIELALESARAYAASLTSFRLPDAVEFDALYAHLERDDFVIYPGQKQLFAEIFRIAVMGDLTTEDLSRLVERARDFPPFVGVHTTRLPGGTA